MNIAPSKKIPQNPTELNNESDPEFPFFKATEYNRSKEKEELNSNSSKTQRTQERKKKRMQTYTDSGKYEQIPQRKQNQFS